MIIKGHAFSANESEVSEKYKKRLAEIKHLAGSLCIRKSPQRGFVRFFGVLPAEEHRQLSELDLALIADEGNLCFGGECTKTTNTFRGMYNTD